MTTKKTETTTTKVTSIKKAATKKTTTRRKKVDDNLIEVVVTADDKYIDFNEFVEKSDLSRYSHDTIVDIITHTDIGNQTNLKVEKVTKEEYEANKMQIEEYFKEPEPTLIKAFKTKFGNYVLFTDVITAASIFMPYNLEAILKMNREDFVKYVLSLPAIEEYKEDLPFDEYAVSFAKIAANSYKEEDSNKEEGESN